MTLDSGAVDWVFTPQTAKAFELKQTLASASGVNYRAANGTEIKNHGQRMVKGFALDGSPINVAAQVADVNSNLGSVSKAIEAGNKVVFDAEGSYILHKKSGKKIHVTHDNGKFEFDIWVPKAKSEQQTVNRKTTQNTTTVNNRYAPLSQGGEGDADDMDIGECGPDLVFTRQV